LKNRLGQLIIDNGIHSDISDLIGWLEPIFFVFFTIR
jgi:hypothetical protein